MLLSSLLRKLPRQNRPQTPAKQGHPGIPMGALQPGDVVRLFTPSDVHTLVVNKAPDPSKRQFATLWFTAGPFAGRHITLAANAKRYAFPQHQPFCGFLDEGDLLQEFEPVMSCLFNDSRMY